MNIDVRKKKYISVLQGASPSLKNWGSLFLYSPEKLKASSSVQVSTPCSPTLLLKNVIFLSSSFPPLHPYVLPKEDKVSACRNGYILVLIVNNKNKVNNIYQYQVINSQVLHKIRCSVYICFVLSKYNNFLNAIVWWITTACDFIPQSKFKSCSQRVGNSLIMVPAENKAKRLFFGQP